MQHDLKTLARMFKVLSVETRVRILTLLKEHPHCVNALSRRLEITQGAVSQHLRILRDAGLIQDDKKGSFVHYRLVESSLEEWHRRLGELLTPGENGDSMKEKRG